MNELVLSWSLWLAALAHFGLLAVGAQIPSHFEWKAELAQLSPPNRKLMWTYGGYTAMTILAFGLLTLALHDELLAGGRGALAVAAFIGTFWLVRLLVDGLYFRHSIWPPGRRFVVAHVLLDSLFVFLAGTYLAVLGWHWLGR